MNGDMLNLKEKKMIWECPRGTEISDGSRRTSDRKGIYTGRTDDEVPYGGDT